MFGVVTFYENCFTRSINNQSEYRIRILGNQSSRRIQDFMLRMTKFAGSSTIVYYLLYNVKTMVSVKLLAFYIQWL